MRWFLASLMMLVFCVDLRADELTKELRKKPASCEVILKRVAGQNKKRKADISDVAFLTAVKERGTRLVAAHIQRIEGEVIRLRLQRDDILNNPPVDKKRLAAIERKIQATREPAFLDVYRARIRQLQALQEQIEKLSFADVESILLKQDSAQTVTAPTPIATQAQERSRFRIRVVLRTALLGALSIPVFGGLVVPSLSHATKWAATEARIAEAQLIPSFSETLEFNYNNVLIPLSDWTHETYGQRGIDFIQDRLRALESNGAAD